MKPFRVQLSRKKGWRMPPNSVIVSRPSKWGNPFRAIAPETPEKVKKAVEYYRAYVTGTSNSFECGPETGVTMAFIPPWHLAGELRKSLGELRGKNLACWCPAGSACHADVLLELANA